MRPLYEIVSGNGKVLDTPTDDLRVAARTIAWMHHPRAAKIRRTDGGPLSAGEELIIKGVFVALVKTYAVVDETGDATETSDLKAAARVIKLLGLTADCVQRTDGEKLSQSELLMLHETLSAINQSPLSPASGAPGQVKYEVVDVTANTIMLTTDNLETAARYYLSRSMYVNSRLRRADGNSFSPVEAEVLGRLRLEAAQAKKPARFVQLLERSSMDELTALDEAGDVWFYNASVEAPGWRRYCMTRHEEP